MTELRKLSQISHDGYNSQETKKFILRVNIPDVKQERILEINNNDLIWDAKLRILQNGDVCLREPLNYGFFMSPKNGKCGKFLDEWRPAQHYSFETPLDTVEFVKKRRLYKNSGLSELKIKKIKSKANTCEFMRLIKANNIEGIVHFLNKGFDPNCRDSETGETPLTLAVKYSNCDKLVGELFRGGAHVDFRNGGSQTALHEAVKCHNINAVKALLNLGMSAKVRDGDNLTPLYQGVAINCSIDIIKLLLYDHSPVGCVNVENGLSELHLACMHCPVSVVDLLLFYGADFNLKSKNGETCLHICARLDKADSAHCLLTRGINPCILNKNGKRALEVAVLCRNTETAAVIRDFDRTNINPHNDIPARNERRRSDFCEPRVSLSQNDLSRQSRMSSVTSAFSSLINRMKSKKPKVVGSLLPNNQILSGLRYTGEVKPRPSRPFSIRTLYIVRNRQPFGFVLRGPKKRKTEEELNSLGDTLPSYHFIESVAKDSVAERAGLSVNDFILEIDNRDVRCLSHTEVVTIIRRCGAEITFKVGTYVSETSQNANPVVIPEIERNDASLLLKSKLTVNSLNVVPNSTGASMRTRNEIDNLFVDETDSEEIEPPVLPKDVIIPPPEEFCDVTICPSKTRKYSPVQVPLLPNDIENQFKKTIKQSPPPMPPMRTTSIQCGIKPTVKEPQQMSPTSHMDELRAALQKRTNQGGSIVEKIERKREPSLNFDTKVTKSDLLGKYYEKVNGKSSVSSRNGVNSVLSRMGAESKPSLSQYDSGIEVIPGYKNDPCDWLLNLNNKKVTKAPNKTTNFVGKQTIF